MMQPDTAAPGGAGFRRVSSDHGVKWWSAGWQLLFHRNGAGVWIGMVLAATIFFLLLDRLPALGWIVGQLAWFVLAGGLMIAARKTDEGTAPPFSDLFAGFGPALGALVIGALVVCVCVFVIFGALMMAGIGAAIGAALGGLLHGGVIGFGALAGFGLTSAFLVLVALVLMVPVGMATWLAPALIVLKQRPPVDALKESAAACWGNMGPLTIYGLLWILFAILASIPLGLGWLILAPLMVLSSYAAYKDLFEAA
jgi:hypothetical protein